jgi:CheY-like chemotaxis protein
MSTPSNPATILVVDDESQMEPLFQLRYRKNLKAGEYQFIYVLSAFEALELLDQNPAIDIVLCDINMPGMNGLTLLPKLFERNEMLRVVMVSAYGNMQNIRKAMNLGAYDFVTKPIDFDDLKMTIKKTLKGVEIGKRAKMSKELEEKNQNLMALDQMKSHFFTNISHEFRTPLTAILGTADQIKLDPDQWVEKGIPVIKRNGSHLLNLITQVLDLRQLETGNLEIKLLGHLVNKSLADHPGKAALNDLMTNDLITSHERPTLLIVEDNLDVAQWGDIAWTSMAKAFFGCGQLNISAVDQPDLSAVRDMSDMFNGAVKFETLREWDKEIQFATSFRKSLGPIPNSLLKVVEKYPGSLKPQS